MILSTVGIYFCSRFGATGTGVSSAVYLITGLFRELKQFSNIEVEISGGITIDNVADYAEHADFISLGSLTMSSKPVDFSLHVI